MPLPRTYRFSVVLPNTMSDRFKTILDNRSLHHRSSSFVPLIPHSVIKIEVRCLPYEFYHAVLAAEKLEL